MTNDQIDALLRRTKAYGCDIRANHDSLMLVGELAEALREMQARVKELEADGERLMHRLNMTEQFEGNK